MTRGMLYLLTEYGESELVNMFMSLLFVSGVGATPISDTGFLQKPFITASPSPSYLLFPSLTKQVSSVPDRCSLLRINLPKSEKWLWSRVHHPYASGNMFHRNVFQNHSSAEKILQGESWNGLTMKSQIAYRHAFFDNSTKIENRKGMQ